MDYCIPKKRHLTRLIVSSLLHFGQPPTAECQDIEVDVSSGSAQIDVGDIDNGSSCNCDIILSITDIASMRFGCSDVGVPRDVSLTATDPSGNAVSCTCKVTATNHVPVPDAGFVGIVFVNGVTTDPSNGALAGRADDDNIDNVLTTTWDSDCDGYFIENPDLLKTTLSFAQDTEPALCFVTLTASDLCLLVPDTALVSKPFHLTSCRSRYNRFFLTAALSFRFV